MLTQDRVAEWQDQLDSMEADLESAVEHEGVGDEALLSVRNAQRALDDLSNEV